MRKNISQDEVLNKGTRVLTIDDTIQCATTFYIIREKVPELMDYFIQVQVFPSASGGGEAMARAFGVPFLGRLPLDQKMTHSCEEGKSFLEEYPNSVAAPAFEKIVQGIFEHC